MPLPQSILVSGSLAYDHIMTYDGLFQEMLLKEKLENLSVTFIASMKSIHYGGCGGNIAYTLKLLGANPLLLGLAGKDFDGYFDWLAQNQIDSSGIKVEPNFYTASAYILTDSRQNQITFFQPGAMKSAPELLTVKDFSREHCSWAILAPDDFRRTVRLARELHEAKIPYIFDPAQQINEMAPADLKTGMEWATVLIVNEYEAELVAKKLGISREQLMSLTANYIETHGERGCSIHTPEGDFYVKAVKASAIVDPTGCGDAFRAGLLAGLNMGFSLEKACQMGTLAATYNLEQKGTQSHRFTMEQFKQRFEENFGDTL